MRPGGTRSLALGDTEPSGKREDWLQQVPLLRVTPTTKSDLTVVADSGETHTFKYLEEFTMATSRTDTKVTLDLNDIVFAG